MRVYQWTLPEDLGPLREAVRRLTAGEFDAAMFTTSIQVAHLFQVAAEAGVEEQLSRALRGIVVASVGPTTSEALEEHGIQPDLSPSRPKMGYLVKETAEQAHTIQGLKKADHAPET